MSGGGRGARADRTSRTTGRRRHQLCSMLLRVLHGAALLIALLLQVDLLQPCLSSTSTSSGGGGGGIQERHPRTTALRASPNLTGTTIQYLGFWGPDQPENMSSFSACHYAFLCGLCYDPRAGRRAPDAALPLSSMQQIYSSQTRHRRQFNRVDTVSTHCTRPTTLRSI